VSVRFRYSKAGYEALLLSAGVHDDVEHRVQAIARTAETDSSWDQRVSGVPGDETIPYKPTTEVRTVRGMRRWTGRVTAAHPAAAAVEAKHRPLGRAFDAAR
jgi:hypothetical protein